MNEKMKRAMREAVKLARTGQAQEATKRLQRTLNGGDSASTVRAAVEKLAHKLPEAARQGVSHGAQSFGHLLPDLSEVTRGFSPQTAAPPQTALGEGQFLTGSFTNRAGTRPYKLYIPAGMTERVPLVVMLHGCTQNPDDFAAGTRMNIVADRAPCLVLYPEQPAGANPNRCWNWFQEADQRCGAGEPSLIAGMIGQVMQQYPVDARRVYVAGLSAGGAMAAIMGAVYPELFAAVCVHSGLPYGAAKDLPSALQAMRQGCGTDISTSSPVPTIVFHGDRDGTVSPRNGEAVVRGLSAGQRYEKRTEKGQVQGGRPYTRTRYLDSRGQVRLEDWRVHGAGHAWFGGSAAGSYTDPKGPDATGAMLRFFSLHSRAV